MSLFLCSSVSNVKARFKAYKGRCACSNSRWRVQNWDRFYCWKERKKIVFPHASRICPLDISLRASSLLSSTISRLCWRGIWLWKHPHLNSSAMLSHFGVFLTYIFPKGPKAFNVMLMVWLLPPFLHDPLFSTRFSCRKSRLCTSSPFVRARF